MQKTLFFDIETIPNPQAARYLPEITPPSNYKDPDKIAAYIADKEALALEKAALDPDLGQIAAISYSIGLERTTKVLTIERRSEKDLLSLFWAFFSYCNGVTCGYNILAFDLPYLLRRSFALGVRVGEAPDLRRYQTYPTTDLMQILFNWSNQNKSLKFVCNRYGIEDEMPEVSGSQFEAMDWPTRRAYAKNGTDLNKRLAKLMRGVYLP